MSQTQVKCKECGWSVTSADEADVKARAAEHAKTHKPKRTKKEAS